MRVTKEFKFEAAHRLTSSYTEACQNIHGHSYRVLVGLDGTEDQLNEDGMVMDFKKIKDLINPMFNILDHSIIFHEIDKDYIDFFMSKHKKETLYLLGKTPITMVGRTSVVIMEKNPTAENMCLLFHEIIRNRIIGSYPELKDFMLSVKVFETVTGEAYYENII